MLGTTKRSDGTTQVTYNNHPLYTFVGDKGKRGATTGEGLDAFGAKWYVVAADGHREDRRLLAAAAVAPARLRPAGLSGRPATRRSAS